jgi:hypothetical protein
MLTIEEKSELFYIYYEKWIHIYKEGDIVDNLLILELLKHKSNATIGDRAYKYKCLIDNYIGDNFIMVKKISPGT